MRAVSRQMGLCFLYALFTIFTLLPGVSFAEEGFTEKGAAIPQNLQDAWNATVFVERISEKSGSSSGEAAHGTGFVVAYDANTQQAIIVSNAHVAGCTQGYKCRYDIRFLTETEATYRTSSARLLGSFPESDLAVLQVDLTGKAAPTVLKIRPEIPTAPMDVAAIGYPSLSIRGKKKWANPRPSDYKSTYKRLSVGSFQGFRAVFAEIPFVGFETAHLKLNLAVRHNADTLKGSSGGPLVNEKGELVGVNSGIIKPAKGSRHCESSEAPETLGCTYYSVPARLVVEKLKELNVTGM